MLHGSEDVVLDGGTEDSIGPVLSGVQDVLRLQG